MKSKNYFFTLSIIFHIGFFILLYISNLNFKNKTKIDPVTIIDAEIIGIINQTKDQNKPQITDIPKEEVKKEETIKEEVKEYIKEEIQENITLLKKMDVKKEIEAPIKKETDVPAKIEVKKDPKQIKPASEVVKEKNKESKIITDKEREQKIITDRKKEQKKINDQILALKKSLNQANLAINNAKSKNKDNKGTNTSNIGEINSATLASTIKAKIIKCWNIPPLIGIETQKLYVILRIKLDSAGNITNIKVVNNNHNDFFKTIAESAINAAHSCSPLLDLPRDRYEEWKEIELIFDPTKIIN